jgi:hypothetical protein
MVVSKFTDRRASTQWASEGIYQRPIGYVAFFTPARPWCDVGQVTMLPDVALPRIFDFYISELPIEAWHTDACISRMVKYRLMSLAAKPEHW